VSEVVELVWGEALAVVKDSAPVRAPVADDDARVLGEAAHGGTDLFVTGDAALLKLGRGSHFGVRVNSMQSSITMISFRGVSTSWPR
jgi:hypothetical protein